MFVVGVEVVCFVFGEEHFERLEFAEGIGGVVFVDAALAALAAVGDAVEGVEQEAEFAGGLDVSLVEVVVGLAELLEGVEELVGGERFDDVFAVLFEGFEVLGDGGVGAAHLLGDLAEGESLAAE